MAFDWPKHPDGTNKKLGEMTQEQRLAAFTDSVERIGSELNDPNSPLRRGINAVLTHGDIPKA